MRRRDARWLLLGLVAIPPALAVCRPVVTGATGPALIPTLRGTGQLALLTACLLAVAPRGVGTMTPVSLAVRVIPCLDVDAGRVVKGVNFTGLRDAGDPVELARRYDEQGADELTFLDITASSGERETTYEVVRRTADQVFIPLTVGGGVRTVADVDALLRAGADKVGVNTAAITRPGLLAEIAERFGRQVLVLSVDARRRRDHRPASRSPRTAAAAAPASTRSAGRDRPPSWARARSC